MAFASKLIAVGFGDYILINHTETEVNISLGDDMATDGYMVCLDADSLNVLIDKLNEVKNEMETD